MWKIYTVKTLYRSTAIGKPKATDKYYRQKLDMIEERIVVIKARSFQEAIKKGVREAKKYASSETHINPYGQKVVQEYIGTIDAFEPYEEIAENNEIYSSTQLAPAVWTNRVLTDRMLGVEYKNERQLRRKFCNREFPGVVKKKKRWRGAERVGPRVLAPRLIVGWV